MILRRRGGVLSADYVLFLQRKTAGDEADDDNDSTSAASSILRSNLRDRLRRMRTPEASRREDKRRSID